MDNIDYDLEIEKRAHPENFEPPGYTGMCPECGADTYHNECPNNCKGEKNGN